MKRREDRMMETISRREFLQNTGSVVASAAVFTAGAGALAGDAPAKALDDPNLAHETVRFPSGDGTLSAFYGRPKAAGRYPLVLVVHEIFGLNDHIKDVTGRLAQAGFAGLAVDLYARAGGIPETTDFAALRQLMDQIPDQQIVHDLQAGIRYAATRPEVNGEKVGSVGFCMGGLYSLLLASHTPDLDAVVAFYGRVVYAEKTPNRPEAPMDRVPQIRAAVQGHYGTADTGIPVETVERFQEALKAAELAREVEFYFYEGAPHAFHNDTRPNYRPEAAKLAWSRTIAFFNKHLKAQEATAWPWRKTWQYGEIDVVSQETRRPP
jgi:carboxymethylenebutenolidase